MSISPTIREQVRERAQGRCEYCLVPERVALVAHEVDHVIARKHGGTDDVENLAWTCTLCNKLKGTDLTSLDPETGKLTRLYNPRRGPWSDHFRLKGAHIESLTAVGRTTTYLLQLNRAERVTERRLLIETGVLVAAGKY